MPPIPLEISCTEVRNWRTQAKDFLLVDCREPDEQALVAIEGAYRLPMSELLERGQELAGQQQPLVVYCHHGQRSAQAATWLRGQGLSHAQSMAGGIDAWACEVDHEMTRY
ncbi:MAG: rhodanese [Pirellulales bacterium]|nr:rhodanese [Pirellulales bacterium]